MMRAMAVCALAFVLSLPAHAGNMLVNGDFETGDLYGWTEAAPDTVPRYLFHESANLPTPAQVFTADAPLDVYEMYDDPDGTRHMKRVALAHEPKPRKGYSVGWTRAGAPKMSFPWISQYLRVPPGRYLVNASWDVIVRDATWEAATFQTGALFMVLVDSQIHQSTRDERAMRRSTWNHECTGQWVSRNVENHQIDTRTGGIEVRLQMWDHSDLPVPLPGYVFVAYDNVYFDLIPVRTAAKEVKP